MKSIELFAGIGGIALAAEWAGIETVAFCERDPYCQKVLNKNFPGVPIFDDVHALNRQLLEEKGVIEPGGTVDILSGGYPCQGESVIGKRKGKRDDRWLWPEMFRLTKELHPDWVVGENVAGHITMGLDTVLSDLESEDYQTRVFVLPAVSVGAPHQRYRTFVVANSGRKSESQAYQSFSTFGSGRNTRGNLARGIGPSVSQSYWKIHQSPVVGVDDGFPNRVDRSIALGNAVVPQQIFPIFYGINYISKKIEKLGELHEKSKVE
ncbi:DNA (cytosine-5-)-methyltransferase [Bacillus velezensis]|uniref:DNA cytosine methyltransferase n=1 Tax=Bacillus velezensis TaxID=492670 RepID=UPI0011AD6F32|nr:DNA cytosine methyltransferase [Bacillus velezensis]TWO94513.1 DNA (cytosine-5-)-methyltransferase [Bacillus velezensis]